MHALIEGGRRREAQEEGSQQAKESAAQYSQLAS